ncbi:MAG: TonB C-terminal domain-containing protein, partial [Thermoanaerobaculia bacterium]|nr:TonB C-terminal domain-containing protein [Thermoanaerobaculia bacterium]
PPPADSPAASGTESAPQGSPTGAASGLALGAAVAGLDNPNFTYGYYVDQMLAMISRNWVRPPVGSGVEATLHFTILRDGRISDLRVSQSSGINGFDLAALRAVQSASPLPPLPSAFRESTLGVNLIVR